MAIIRAPSDGFETLLQTLLNKEQLEQAKEAQKLEAARFKMEQEKVQFDRQRALASQDASQILLSLMGGGLTQEELQGAAQGASPEVAQALLAQGTELLGQQSERDLTKAQIANFDTLRDLEQQRIDLDARRVAAEESNDEIALRRLGLEERDLEFRMGQASRELASRELQTVFQIAGAQGLPVSQVARQMYGTDNLDEVRGILEGDLELSVEERRERQLTRSLEGFGIKTPTQNALREALFVEGGDPQTFVDELFAREEGGDEGVLPQTKADIFYALASVYPQLRLPETLPSPSVMQRLQRLFGPGLPNFMTSGELNRGR